MLRGSGAKLAITAVMLAGLGQGAYANAPERSSRPLLRPGHQITSTAPAAKTPAHNSPAYNIVVRYHADIRPKLRPGTPLPPTGPDRVVPTAYAPVRSAAGSGSALAVAQSPRPQLRPRSFVTGSGAVARSAPAARPTAAAAPKATGKYGALCGVRSIRGQKLSAIPGQLPGCGQSKPVKVSEVGGVRLSTAAIMDCGTAKALNSWVRKGVVPAVGRLGGGPAELTVIGHYSCRTRNNKPGGKISEHGKGKAVDIAGLTLKNGAKISVLKGWRDPVQGKVLKAMHASACGPFGTVLGPNADRYHQDHLHLDTARHRGGSYCR